jgi:hypothetical protein
VAKDEVPEAQLNATRKLLISELVPKGQQCGANQIIGLHVHWWSQCRDLEAVLVGPRQLIL